MYGVWSTKTRAELYVKDRKQLWELGLDQSLEQVSGGLKSLAKAVDKWGKEYTIKIERRSRYVTLP